ncbi:response regulator transcription factor [Nocardia bovistercoris]|uniref:Helix-turn-helix transcriptional regulator n=1 Tax=Nocardia bovistercoris TaxID=2785916 RepID=A0A931II07_9NOCA|nr:helix-turn-helix transcriptional regulator [Nocardia bovistercoris]MBH0781799.1 helix-turn-helix transcriptional regulator [Nocardia bovistercoris]
MDIIGLRTSHLSTHSCINLKILRTAGAAWLEGDAVSTIALAEAAATARCRRGSECCTALASLQLALLLTNLRCTDEARRAVRQAAATIDDPAITSVTALVRAKIALCEGSFDEADDLCDTGMGATADPRLASWAPIGNMVRALTAMRRGAVATMIRYADQLKEDVIFGRDTFPWNSPAWLVVQIIEAEKGWEVAVPLARRLLDSESSTRRLLLSEPTAASFLVRILLRADEREPAQRARHCAAVLAEQNPEFHVLSAASLHLEGLLEKDVGLLKQTATSDCDAWTLALMNEDIGDLLAEDSREFRQACAHYETAMRSYAEAGSPRDSSRVRSKLRPHNTSMAAARFWPNSRIPVLTDTEYAVAELVAGGLTNAEVAGKMFLSRHTVAFHLRKIFQKVGAKSRIELAVMWKQLVAREGLDVAGGEPLTQVS